MVAAMTTCWRIQADAQSGSGALLSHGKILAPTKKMISSNMAAIDSEWEAFWAQPRMDVAT